MHVEDLRPWQHPHDFLGSSHATSERQMWAVVGITIAMMMAEIVGGTAVGSMALVADGWHMATHAAALGIAALAYRLARAHNGNPAFTFGTGKISELAGFASATILVVIAVLIGIDCAGHLLHPSPIHLAEAFPIAVLGLIVNLLSAWLLHDEHDHGDLNRHAAFAHVLADALTSLGAIAGLGAAWAWGWNWLDPVIGLVGAAVIISWAYGLIVSAGKVLLDTVPDPALADAIKARLEEGLDRVSDLHLWRLGPGHFGLVATVVSDQPQSVEVYKARLGGIDGLSHVTIEVAQCPGIIEDAPVSASPPVGEDTRDRGRIINSRFGAGALLVYRDAETGRSYGLVQQRSAEEHEPFTWSIYGGMNEPGEWPFGVMLREVYEESGIDVRPFPNAHVHRFDAADEAFSFHTYLVFLPSLIPPVLSNESINARWVKLGATVETLWENLPQPMMQGMQTFVNDRAAAERIIKILADGTA
jgi:cation diffusion facilitator family transporter